MMKTIHIYTENWLSDFQKLFLKCLFFKKFNLLRLMLESKIKKKTNNLYNYSPFDLITKKI